MHNDELPIYKSRNPKKKEESKEKRRRRQPKILEYKKEKVKHNELDITPISRPMGTEYIGYSDTQRALKRILGEDLGSIEKLEETLIEKRIIVFDSHFRDSWTWPTSTRFKLNFVPTEEDIGPIKGVQPIRNVIRIKLLKAKIPNLYIMPVQSIDIGYNSPYAYLQLNNRKGNIFGSNEPYGSRGFFALLSWGNITDPSSLNDLKISKIIGGDITYDPPLLLLENLELLLCNQNGDIIDTTYYDGIPITGFDNTFFPNAVIIYTGYTHALKNGDVVSVQLDTGDAIDGYTEEEFYPITRIDNFSFTIPVYDPVSTRIYASLIGYMRRYDFNCSYVFEITSLNPRVN